MYAPYLKLGSAKALIKLHDTFGVNNEFEITEYYLKTGEVIPGQCLKELRSSKNLIRCKLTFDEIRKKKPNRYYIPESASQFIERYALREACAP